MRERMNRIDPLGYLPELYMKPGGFTDRFLSVFTEIYRGLEEKIDASAELYDPEICPDGFVEWLGGWISAENMEHFTAEGKRALLLLTPRLAARRGTLSALRELLELYCGARVFIVERYHAERYFRSFGDLARLYSGGRFTVWILCAPTRRRTDALEELTLSQLPANMTARIKRLASVTELNNYCYLGVNSVIAGTRRGVLDGGSALNYVHLGGGE